MLPGLRDRGRMELFQAENLYIHLSDGAAIVNSVKFVSEITLGLLAEVVLSCFAVLLAYLEKRGKRCCK